MLQMIERVLASLIILGMLVIVMFLAFNKNGRDLVRTENEPAVETQAKRGVETRTDRTVETQTQQPTERTLKAEKPKPQMQAERTPPVVPNPGTPPPKKTPAPAEKKMETARAPEKSSVPKSAQKRVKQKVVKKTRGRLRESTVAEAKSATRENVTRIERTPPMAYDDDRDDARRPHRYLRRADYRKAWRRTDDYECADGRCDCSCEPRYYWARTPPECWDW